MPYMACLYFYFIEVITIFIEVYFMYFSASLDSHNIGVNPFPQGYKSTKPRNERFMSFQIFLSNQIFLLVLLMVTEQQHLA